MESHHRIGLVLSGGGTRGLAHIGALKILSRLEFRPDCIVGCSMGGIVGAMLAAGRTPTEMEEFALQQKVWKLLQWPIGKLGLKNLSKFETLLVDFLGVTKFSELKIPLIINSTDMTHARTIAYDEGLIWPAIRASISIPGLFAPVENKGQIEVDGGVLNQHPFTLLPPEISRFILIDTSPETTVTSHQPSVVSLLQASVGIMQNEITRLRLEKIVIGNFVIVAPDLTGHGLLETEKNFKSLINRGAIAARQASPRITRLMEA